MTLFFHGSTKPIQPRSLLICPTPCPPLRHFCHRLSLHLRERLRLSYARKPCIQRRSLPQTRVTTNHAPLSCGAEDESQVNPVIPGVRTQAVMSRFAGLVTVPTTIEPKAQYRQADCAGGCATSPRLLLSHRKLRTKLRTLSG